MGERGVRMGININFSNANISGSSIMENASFIESQGSDAILQEIEFQLRQGICQTSLSEADRQLLQEAMDAASSRNQPLLKKIIAASDTVFKGVLSSAIFNFIHNL